MMTTEAKIRECWRCRCVGPGEHRPDGKFDQWSVEVSDAEVDYALNHSTSIVRNRRKSGTTYSSTARDPLHVRWNIAFGKHIGTYISPI